MLVSSCCGVSIIENTDLCSMCKEHCDAVSESWYYGEEDLTWLTDKEWQPTKVTLNEKEIR